MSTPRFKQPELDILRFVAFLMVFVHHCAAHTFAIGHPGVLFSMISLSGAAGVCIFFTLSSYLITELLQREHERTGTVSIRKFMVRRILRIWPLYSLAIAAACIAPHFFHSIESANGLVLPYLLMYANWIVASHHVWPNNPILVPLWSISVELQFYLVWPLLFLFLGKSRFRKVSFAVLGIGLLTDLIVSRNGAVANPTLWCNSFSQFQFFALGSLISLFTHKRRIELYRWQRITAMSIACTALALASSIFQFAVKIPVSPARIVPAYALLDLSCLGLFLALLQARVPSWSRPFIYLGQISYGLYVFHYPAIWLTGALVLRLHVHMLEQICIAISALLLTVACAAVSYRWFEMPFNNLKERFEVVKTRPVEGTFTGTPVPSATSADVLKSLKIPS